MPKSQKQSNAVVMHVQIPGFYVLAIDSKDSIVFAHFNQQVSLDGNGKKATLTKTRDKTRISKGDTILLGELRHEEGKKYPMAMTWAILEKVPRDNSNEKATPKPMASKKDRGNIVVADLITVQPRKQVVKAEEQQPGRPALATLETIAYDENDRRLLRAFKMVSGVRKNCPFTGPMRTLKKNHLTVMVDSELIFEVESTSGNWRQIANNPFAPATVADQPVACAVAA